MSIPVGPARQFTLAGFAPRQKVEPNTPVSLTFTIKLPIGKALTQYKTGAGPHTGVHLIIVRDDLAYIIHKHPPITTNGLLRQTVTFPAPGSYRVLVDAYRNIPGGQPNFQLHPNIDVSGADQPKPHPKFSSNDTVDGYHFSMAGTPHIHAIQALFLHVNVTSPSVARCALSPGITLRARHPIPLLATAAKPARRK